MGRARILKMVLDGLEAAGQYVRPKTIEAVRRSAWDRLATVLRRPEVGADHLPGLEDLSDPIWKRIRDSVWQYNEELGKLKGQYQYSTISINPKSASPESIGVHELAHHIYSQVFTPKQRKLWTRTVKSHGRPVFEDATIGAFDEPVLGGLVPFLHKGGALTLRPAEAKSLLKLRGHPTLSKTGHYQNQIRDLMGESWSGENAEHFVANTESLAFALEDILTPGKEITAPLGLVRGVERIFDARGLIDRVAHRLPLSRR